MTTLLKRVFPFLSWFADYDRTALKADLIAGVTVALVLVPQSMAYAQLAGLPAYYGLYAAFLPPIVASLFGSSRQLATGPVAVVSLVTAAALEPLATAGSAAYVAYAVLLALLVGLVQLALGVLRLGLVVNFLSHPVVNGFTNAAALIIATSQLDKIFGVQVEKAELHFETVGRVLVAAVTDLHVPTLAMAALGFAIMLVLKRKAPRWPNVLVAAVVTTLVSWAVGYEERATASLAQLNDPRAAELLHAVDEARELRSRLEQLQRQGRAAADELQQGQQALCTRCHAQRDLAWFTAPDAPPTAPGAAAPGLALHALAGLLDQHVADVKVLIRDYQRELDQRRYLAVSTDAEPAYYPVEAVPAGATVIGGPWRLRLGNQAPDRAALGLSGGGAVIGAIPAGLPAFALPTLEWKAALSLLPAALIISLLGFMEAISIAKAMAARTRQKLDANQELIGQGLGNILGCFGQSYPVSGSFSRSAVNLQAGGRTGMANVVSGLIVVVVLLFFSKLLYHLPQAVLAAIIMMAVLGLLSPKSFLHAWHTNRLDGLVAVLTFVGTLALAPDLEGGIAAGVLVSLGAYLYRTMRPAVLDLAPHPDGSLRDARRHSLRKCKRIAVISFEGPLNFASVNYLEDEILARVAEQPELRHVLIAANGVSEIDASGEETLRNIIANLRNAGYEVSFSGVPDTVLDVLRRAHLYETIGAERFYATRAQALAQIFVPAHAGAEEPDCPYHQAMPPVVELSLHPDGSLRDAKRHGLRRCLHIAALRFDAPLNFANTGYLQQEIVARLSDRPSLRHVVFVAHGISEIDTAGAKKLGELVLHLRSSGFAVSFSGLKENVVATLESAHVADTIGTQNMYSTQAAVIAAIYPTAHAGSSEENCPLWPLAPHLVELAVHPDGSLRDARRHHLALCDHLAVLQLQGPMVLSDRKAIRSEFIRWAKRRPTVRNVVLVASSVPQIDRPAAENLLALIEEMRAAEYRVACAGFSDASFDSLARLGVADAIGIENIFPLDLFAVAGLHPAAHIDSDEPNCPLAAALPQLTELALADDGSLRSAARYGLALCPHLVVLRFDGPLNYGTIGFFEAELLDRLQQRKTARHLLIVGHTIANLDPIAADELGELFARLRQEGYTVGLSGLREPVHEVLEAGCRRAGVVLAHIYPTQAQALDALHPRAHAGVDEVHCPLREVIRLAAGSPAA